MISEVPERQRKAEIARIEKEAAEAAKKAKQDAKDSVSRKMFSIRLKRAEEGSAEVQYDLAVQFANGEGIPKDEAKARMWLEKAAAQGHGKAKKMLETLSAPVPSK